MCVGGSVWVCVGGDQSLVQKTAAVYETAEVFSGFIFRGTGAVFRSFGFNHTKN